MTRIPSTKTVVNYSYTITDSGGTPIGNLQGFNPTATRTLERVRQILNEERDIVEIVPGRTEDVITLDRLELYGSSLAQALSKDWSEDLAKITDPISIMEVVTGPLGQTRTISYLRCWIQTWGKTLREGTTTVTENVTLWPEEIQVST